MCGSNHCGGENGMALDNGTELNWLGHATWLLTTPQGTRVLIDPWLTGNPKASTTIDEIGGVDVILLTHGHSDHTGDVVAAATNGSPDAVIAMIELGDYYEMKGMQNVLGINKGGTAEVAGIRFTMVDAHHSSSFIEDNGTIVYTGEPAGYIVTLESGFRIYIAGDTCVFGDMQLIGRLYKPDLAVLPIGGYYTMDPFEAAEAIRLLGVKKVVGTHWGTFPALAGTPDQLRKEASDVEGLEVIDVDPGGTVR
jgi:L-ascorbate metabolism protein UlaG (beta-lactamase superfamily)